MYDTTSNISIKYGCEYSTNGGFFNTNHSAEGSKCEGNLVSDSYVVQIPTDTSGTKRANLGINNKNEIIIGFMDNTTIDSIVWTQLMTGNGWVVRNGQSYVNSSPDLGGGTSGFCTEKAPRTAVGMLNNGSMILLEIDGEEDISAGPDLHEQAELLVSLGVASAVNIDGGGSSVAVEDGIVIDTPTCKDTPVVCERAVASFACVRKA
jgi:exopolysaccharide biosynthesis protein